MVKILVIAPYPELAKKAEDISAVRQDIEISTFVGDLDGALVYINGALNTSKYDVILSRGGTARLIREHTHIPVVEIKVTVLDALRCLKGAQLTGRPFIVVGFSNITSAMKTLADVLCEDIEIHEINSRKTAESLLSASDVQASKPIVLGDTVTTNVANELGLDWMLIDSGAESLAASVDDAVSIARNIKNAIANNEMFGHVIENSPSCVFIFNSRDSLCYINHLESSISTAEITSFLKMYLPYLRKAKNIHVKKKMKPFRLDIIGKEYKNSDDVYAVFYIDITNYYSSRSTQSIISEENADDVRQHESMSVYPPSYLRAIIEQADNLFSEKSPLVVYGEAGTGKDYLVRNIYLQKYENKMPLVTIYCPYIDNDAWDDLVRDVHSPLYGSNSVIYFKSIHTLPTAIQRKLDHFLEETGLLSRNAVICSSRLTLADMVANSVFIQSLYLKLETNSVFIPPLRECRDEIKDFTAHFLHCYNSRYGKNIIGFQDRAEDLLTDHFWHMNIEELRQTVKKLVNSCSEEYISYESVSNLLTSLPDEVFDITPIDLTKTLDEIELDIIKHVLISENMSHSQTAKRLGISRSTLWRKLNCEK